MATIPTQSGARDQLMNDLKSVVQDAQAWLSHSGQLTGDELKAARAKLEQTLSTAKDDLIRLEETVIARSKEAARATDEYVQENPWKAVGVGAAVGVLVGLLLARK
jgi:ElaB/YqjD/DUF883 family membrane-anchored ribosome-binding protein